MGIDFYIDGARFMPDNATISKVEMQVFNRQYIETFPALGGS